MSVDWVTIGPCRLACGDCLGILPELEAGTVDAVVTDPPYGISHRCNFASRGRAKLAKCNDYPDVIGDGKPFDPAQLLAFDVPTVLWGANHYSERLPSSGGWLVWDKERPDELDQSTCELAWTNCIKGVRRFRHLWHGMMRASEHGENYHPTQKPCALMRWVLSFSWIPAGDILDPYMGSGTTGVACVQTGRRFVGVEIDPAYFAIACRRIEAAVKDQKDSLFPVAQAKAETPDLFGETAVREARP